MRELQTLLPFLRPYRLTLVLGLGLVVVSNGFATLGPRFVQHGIDAVEAGAPFSAVQHSVLLLLLVAVAGGLARYGMRQLLNSTSRRVEYDLRNRLYRYIQGLSAEFYDRYPTGDVMARTTNDLLAVRMVAGPALMYLVDTLVRTVLVVPVMVHMSPALSALALVPLALLPVTMAFFGSAIHRRSEAIQAQWKKELGIAVTLEPLEQKMKMQNQLSKNYSLSLAGWFAAYFAAQWFTPLAVAYVPMGVPDSALNHGIAFACLFLLTLVIWSLAARGVRLLVHATPLSLIDRVLGAGFGVLRGMVVGSHRLVELHGRLDARNRFCARQVFARTAFHSLVDLTPFCGVDIRWFC